MNKNVIITCAVTGAADTLSKHPDIPVTTTQIADAVIAAAKAGAAVAHIHVRDPDTGQGCRDARLERIWDGTSEIQRHIIAKTQLRAYES